MSAGERELAQRDLLFFVSDVLGYGSPRFPDRPYLCVDTSPDSVHRRLCRSIQDADQAAVTESLVLLPRGFLKSTICTIGYTLWCLARNPDEAILVFGATKDKACFFLSEIKDHCEGNERMLALFPELHPKPEGPWQADRIEIVGRTMPRKEPSVISVGIEQGKAGGHYDRIICDDLHDETNAGTAEQCDKVRRSYQMLRPLLVDQRRGEIRSSATRWHGADNAAAMLERNERAKAEGKPEPVRLFVEAIQDKDGNPTWPTMYDRDEIERIRAGMDPEFFASQYMNDPFGGSNQVFRLADIERSYVDLKEIPENLIYFAACDPGYTANKWSNPTAIVVCGTYHTGHIFLVDIFNQRVELSGLVDALYMMNERWHPVVMSIEANANQIVVQHHLREQMRTRGVLPIRDIARGGGTSTLRGKQRIRRIEPYFRNRSIKILRSVPHLHDLVKQLLDHPNGAFDDIADALADIPEIAFKNEDPGRNRRQRVNLNELAPTTWNEYLGHSFDTPYDGGSVGAPRAIVVR